MPTRPLSSSAPVSPACARLIFFTRPAHRSSSWKPAEQMTTPAELLERYVGELPRELGDPRASPTAFARWAEYERLTWPEWLRSRGASPDAVKLMTVGADSSNVSALYVLRQYAML